MAFTDIVHRIMQMDQVVTEERELIEFEMGVEGKPLDQATREEIDERLPFETTLENYLASLDDEALQKLHALMYWGQGKNAEWRALLPIDRAAILTELLNAESLPKDLARGLEKAQAEGIDVV
jgi:hypothetical protein